MVLPREIAVLCFYVTAEGNCHLFEGDILSGGCEGLARGHDDSAAAGDFHAKHGHAPDGGDPEEFSQFFGVETVVVELGATDDERFSSEEIPVKIRIGKGNTVGGDEKIGVLEIRGARRHKVELYRPLAKSTRLL